ncbi:MAG: hypothetical protein A2Y57_02425 [Candidatus Woykebacteria bacterium RBG_13_40_7b]|uniref:Phosphoglycerate mutase n=1 Tax=Candidatus Woykebacteria bacterium RBG_13_40_7b TaxID=1802594 RepID=A0A1G1WBA0_9BACT|nr:MAG: hypothetical protein A2Y57_02425 [Candidatus Woykebacteria bacterium RBG_13_40_7b]
MKTIYLVRHGEALDDIEDRYGGWSDDPLTEKGRQTARELAEEIANLSPKPKEIYTSSFKRAAETAEIIGKALKLAVVMVEDLKERNRCGVLTSLTRTEAKSKYPDLTEKVEDYSQTITGAETYEYYRDRVLRAFDKILKEADGDILIVAHGGTFRVVMWEILGKPDYKEADLHAVVIIEEENGSLTLKNSKGLHFKS